MRTYALYQKKYLLIVLLLLGIVSPHTRFKCRLFDSEIGLIGNHDHNDSVSISQTDSV